MIEETRQRFNNRRKVLQKRGTKNAKRRLKQISGKEARFRKHTNHCISKELATKAERLSFAIALEDLTGIRKRIKARKDQRSRMHGWGFYQLRQFLDYKCKMRGIPVILIDPHNTSRTCPECGYIDKNNRKTRDTFLCQDCGYTSAADYVGARNISSLGGDVNRPMAPAGMSKGQSPAL